MNARDFQNNSVLTHLTNEIQVIPNKWGLVNRMGFFEPEGITQNSVTFERVTKDNAVIVDQRRGVRSTYGKDEDVKVYSWTTAHFPYDEYITVNDVQGVRRVGTSDEPTTLEVVRAKKLTDAREHQAYTKEKILVEAIKGNIYSPNNTVDTTSVYTAFGITQKVVDYQLDVSTTSVISKGREVVAHIQDNIQDGSVVEGVVALCGETFFRNLVSHANVVQAYSQYQNNNQGSGKQVLRDRLDGGLYETFYHGGITYIEYRGSYGGEALIPAKEAYAFPMGARDMFKLYMSPAYKLSLANTIGEEIYAFEQPLGNDTGWKIETEANLLALNRRPEAVVKMTTP